MEDKTMDAMSFLNCKNQKRYLKNIILGYD